MKTVLALSLRAFQQAFHNRAFIVLLALDIAAVLLSMLLGLLSFTAREVLVQDVALAGISITAAVMMVFLAGEAIVGEIEKGTMSFILSKPVSRRSFLLSRFVGLLLTGAFAIVLGGVLLLALLYFLHHAPALGLGVALVYIFLEIAIIASLGLMFSAFSSSSLTATFLVALTYIVGHLNPQLAIFARLLDSRVARAGLSIIRLLIPNLEYLNIRHQVVLGALPTAGAVAIATAYALLYVTGGIIIAIVAFAQREL